MTATSVPKLRATYLLRVRHCSNLEGLSCSSNRETLTAKSTRNTTCGDILPSNRRTIKANIKYAGATAEKLQ
jgi:hypothetical protein